MASASRLAVEVRLVLEAKGASRRHSDCVALSGVPRARPWKSHGAGVVFAPPEDALAGSEDGPPGSSVFGIFMQALNSVNLQAWEPGGD